MCSSQYLSHTHTHKRDFADKRRVVGRRVTIPRKPSQKQVKRTTKEEEKWKKAWVRNLNMYEKFSRETNVHTSKRIAKKIREERKRWTQANIQCIVCFTHSTENVSERVEERVEVGGRECSECEIESESRKGQKWNAQVERYLPASVLRVITVLCVLGYVWNAKREENSERKWKREREKEAFLNALEVLRVLKISSSSTSSPCHYFYHYHQ